MSATYTVVTLDGQEHKNLDSETVKQWFLQKKLREDSFVMSSETNQWKLLKKVFDLTQWFQQPFAHQPQPPQQTQWQQPMPPQQMPQQQWQPPVQQPQQTGWQQPQMPQNNYQQTEWQPPPTVQPQQQWNAMQQQQWNNYQQPTYTQPQQPVYPQPQQPNYALPQQQHFYSQQPEQQHFYSPQPDVQAYSQQQTYQQQYQPQPQWVSQNNWVAPPAPVSYGVQNYNAAPVRRPGVRAAAVLFFVNAAFGILGLMGGAVASGGNGAYRAGYGFGGLVALIIDVIIGIKLWKADEEVDKYRKIGIWRSVIAFGLSLLLLIPMASTGFGFPLLIVYAMYYGSFILILYGEEPPSQNRVIGGVIMYILSFFFAIGVGVMIAVSAMSEFR